MSNMYEAHEVPPARPVLSQAHLRDCWPRPDLLCSLTPLPQSTGGVVRAVQAPMPARL